MTLARIGGALAVVLYLTRPAQAVDIETLARLLYPPYLAMNYAAICALRDPTFHQETSGPRGSMPAYMQHIKEEVIASLTPAEAQSVMVKAADASKARARADLRALAHGDTIDHALISAWCEITPSRSFALSSALMTRATPISSAWLRKPRNDRRRVTKPPP